MTAPNLPEPWPTEVGDTFPSPPADEAFGALTAHRPGPKPSPVLYASASVGTAPVLVGSGFAPGATYQAFLTLPGPGEADFFVIADAGGGITGAAGPVVEEVGTYRLDLHAGDSRSPVVASATFVISAA